MSGFTATLNWILTKTWPNLRPTLFTMANKPKHLYITQDFVGGKVGHDRHILKLGREEQPRGASQEAKSGRTVCRRRTEIQLSEM